MQVLIQTPLNQTPILESLLPNIVFGPKSMYSYINYHVKPECLVWS